MVVQFEGGPALYIFDCLLVVVQFGGGPAKAGNCVARRRNMVHRTTKNSKMGFRQSNGDLVKGNPLLTWALKIPLHKPMLTLSTFRLE